MSTVWIVTGWFGALEWIESVHATEEVADAACALLAEDGTSAFTPAVARGIARFRADEWEVE